MSTSDKSITPERRRYLVGIRRRNAAVTAAKIAIFVLFFAAWELSGRFGLIDTFIMSQPSRFISAIIDLWRQGVLLGHIGTTCLETVIGFTLGTVFGTLIAILLWLSPFLSKVFEPYLVILNSLPKIALGPVFIVWIGAGPASIIAITISISIVVSIMEVLNGFLQTDKRHLLVIQTLGGTKLHLLTKVVLPANIPTIINSLKINVGMSWVGVIVGEFLVSKAGLGYLIVYGSQVFKLDLVMASVFILALIATVMYRIVVVFERLVTRRRHTTV